jgi:hypothetical protein
VRRGRDIQGLLDPGPFPSYSPLFRIEAQRKFIAFSTHPVKNTLSTYYVSSKSLQQRTRPRSHRRAYLVTSERYKLRNTHQLVIRGKKHPGAACPWLTPVILATEEAEIRRIAVRSQPMANSSQDPISTIAIIKKGLVE